MITLRRAQERRDGQDGEPEGWLSVHPRDRAETPADGFATLEGLSESRLPPGADAARQPRHDAEIVTYVREGALAYEDSTGRSGVILAGEFQRMSSGRGLRRGESNASRTQLTHAFQVRLRPPKAGLESGPEQKRRFSAAERRGGLCVVASSDARRGSLLVHQDVLMYSALLAPGQHVVHEISPGRSAWLHLVEGEATLGDVVLTTGDGAGVRAERAVSLTAREETEILLFDLAEESEGSREA